MFRKLILVLCLLALCITVSSAGITDKLKTVIARKNVAAAGSCMSGTYAYGAWDGDHPSGAAYACYNSGVGNKNGTQSGGTLTSTSFVFTAGAQYVSWVNNVTDMFDNDEGTLYIEILVDAAADEDNVYLFEMYYDVSSFMFLRLDNASGPRLEVTRTGGGQADTVNDSSATYALNSTITVGLSWSVGRGGEDFSITTNKGSNWYGDEVDGIASFANEADEVVIGQRYGSGSGDDTVTITRWEILAGYQAACTW